MKNKNEKLLNDFTKYCKKHPSQRFWQALRNWSGYNFIFGCNEKSILDIDVINLIETYYLEDKQ